MPIEPGAAIEGGANIDGGITDGGIPEGAPDCGVGIIPCGGIVAVAGGVTWSVAGSCCCASLCAATMRPQQIETIARAGTFIFRMLHISGTITLMDMDARFVGELRHTLLDLHKSLMDAQRIAYERIHGRVATSGEFLGLVLEHPEFAWLRALSALIARLDEWMEEKEGMSEELAVIVAALRGLVATEGSNVLFSTAYWKIVNDVPEALIFHVKLWRLLESVRPTA